MKKVLAILFLTALVAAAFTLWYEYQRFMTDTLGVNEPTLYTVEPGMNLRDISIDLAERGILKTPPLYLQLYGRSTQQAHKIQAGEYSLTAEMSAPQALALFVSGKVTMNAITIIEGMTAQQLFALVAQHPKLTHTLTDMSADTVMAAIGAEGLAAEGQFLPETYHFPTGTTDVDFLQRAHKNMQQVLDNAWKNRDKALPYEKAYDALIMASIIEKESAVADERPEIAGVFVRRLKQGMRLQTDPTVIYGLGDKFDGNLRRVDLRTDTPYNTYTRHGLTPTPICLPSVEAIQAAVHPTTGKALYFVATGENGRHVFSNTLQEHNAAVKRYQLKK